ncbi:hypothetical protein VTL71DRAFT_2775 [Oculimacula yallundae]|uniref:Heterokaryon incompatibility domain-containing protein n=1 Tax=Oculimacula yallundae TaxID=86028 RepID=A0ABR4C9T6_9HELO
MAELADSLSRAALYLPLAANHIRILQLKSLTQSNVPGQDIHDSLIEGSLLTLSLKEIRANSGDYVALSYCWQRGRDVRPFQAAKPVIRCDGLILPIQPNLYSALCHFARQEDGPRLIWADALCIDQSNDDEKSQQVAHVGEIYSGVGSVIARLGPEGELVAELFHNDNYEMERIDDGLTFMHRCGWFQRAWTFQEICPVAGKEFISENDNNQHLAREIRFIDGVQRRERDLLFLLLCIWNRDASDKRDNAYAILGLYRGGGVVKPDYTATIRQVLVQISKAVVEHTCSLDIFKHGGIRLIKFDPSWGPRAYDDSLTIEEFNQKQDFTGGWHLPSWMPDWGSDNLNIYYPSQDINEMAKLEFPDMNPKFTLDYRWEGEHLVVAGIAIGRRFSLPDYKSIILPFPNALCSINSDIGLLRSR